MSQPQDIKCTVVRNEDSEWDWWTIERAEHDGREWWEPTEYGSRLMTSARLSPEACIEGTSADMLAIAAAIEQGASYDAPRCAVRTIANGVELESPRNSDYLVLITQERARELAADIRAKVKVE